MEPLLLLNAFPEPWIDAGRAGASLAAEAYFDGLIVFTNWLRSDALRALPPGLLLGRNVSAAPEHHPVVFVFGTQARCACLFGGLTLPTGVSFPELTIAIPFVKREGGQYLHVSIVRICSGEAWSTWIGNTHYGFNKRLADMQWLGRTFTVSAREGPLLLHATVEAGAPWVPARAAGLPSFAAASRVFCLPVLGRRADGSDVCSYFDWDFREASVRPARAVLSIDAPLGPGLDPRACHGAESGTFEVRGMRWRLTWPVPCRF